MSDLWTRYQEYLAVCPTIDLTVDISRMRFDDGFLERMQPGMTAAVRRHGRARAGSDRQPRREAHGRALLAARSRARAHRRDRERDREHQRAHPAVRRGRARRRIVPRARAALSRTCWSSASAARRSGPSSWLLRSATRQRPDAPLLLRQHRSRRHGPRARRHRRRLQRNADHRHLEIAAAPRRRATACSRPQRAYERAGLDFAKHAVAVTGDGSELDKTRQAKAGSPRFPCGTGSADARRSSRRWACCRRRCRESTSRPCSPARATPTRSRATTTSPKNPAALLALMWYFAGGGEGKKDMVVLPYKDRLELFSRYLQQLVMESLGKEKDLEGQRGQPGHRGLRQQRFDRSARVRAAAPRRAQQFLRDVHPGAGERRGRSAAAVRGRAGHHLRRLPRGFLLGTRQALYENGRESITLTSTR